MSSKWVFYSFHIYWTRFCKKYCSRFFQYTFQKLWFVMYLQSFPPFSYLGHAFISWPPGAFPDLAMRSSKTNDLVINNHELQSFWASLASWNFPWSTDFYMLCQAWAGCHVNDVSWQHRAGKLGLGGAGVGRLASFEFPHGIGGWSPRREEPLSGENRTVPNVK